MPVYKQGVEDSIKSSLLTTIGDIIAASAVSTPARIAAPASGQVLTGQGAGVLPAWAAAATVAVTRAGGNTTEATTTSTTIVDVIVTSSLSIGANIPVLVVCPLRKSAGTAATASARFKVNTTEISGTYAWIGSQAGAGAGFVKFDFQTPQTNYDRSGWGKYVGQGVDPANLPLFGAAVFPIATYTSITVMGLVGNADNTMGADEMQVYTYAVS